MALPVRLPVAVAVLAAGVVAAPTEASRLVSPVGGRQLFTEQQLLDELPPLQAQLQDSRLAPVVPLQFELDPGERHPTGIEVVGVARGRRPPQPNPQRANKLVGEIFGFKVKRDPFYVYSCTPSSAFSTGCEQIPYSVPTAAGTYYWHVRPSSEGCVGLAQNCLLAWSTQIETFTIPSVFRLNGFTIAPRTRPCATAGVIRYDSSEPSPVIRYRIAVFPTGSSRPAVRLSGLTGGKRTGRVPVVGGEYQHTLRIPLDGVRAGRYQARLAVSDRAGHGGRARSRKFTVPNPSATCRQPHLRP